MTGPSLDEFERREYLSFSGKLSLELLESLGVGEVKMSVIKDGIYFLSHSFTHTHTKILPLTPSRPVKFFTTPFLRRGD